MPEKPVCILRRGCRGRKPDAVTAAPFMEESFCAGTIASAARKAGRFAAFRCREIN